MTVLQRMHRGGIRIFSTMHKTLAKLRMYVLDEDGTPTERPRATQLDGIVGVEENIFLMSME